MQQTQEQIALENWKKLNEPIEVIVALYGVPNDDEEVLSEQEAMQLFDTLKKQETMFTPHTGYYLFDVRIEGDRESGRILATAKWVA